MSEVSLTSSSESYIERALASGRYADASEVVEEALAMHAFQLELEDETLAEVQAAIEEGLADSKAGRVTVIDSWETFRRAIGLDDEK